MHYCSVLFIPSVFIIITHLIYYRLCIMHWCGITGQLNVCSKLVVFDIVATINLYVWLSSIHLIYRVHYRVIVTAFTRCLPYNVWCLICLGNFMLWYTHYATVYHKWLNAQNLLLACYIRAYWLALCSWRELSIHISNMWHCDLH